tara:strand:+ start:98 stop:202 length:105 start_codon:yes stop_codon:yes gene_type:complete
VAVEVELVEVLEVEQVVIVRQDLVQVHFKVAYKN